MFLTPGAKSTVAKRPFLKALSRKNNLEVYCSMNISSSKKQPLKIEFITQIKFPHLRAFLLDEVSQL
jgi:hypothetical protein